MFLLSFKLIPRASLSAAVNIHCAPSYVVWGILENSANGDASLSWRIRPPAGEIGLLHPRAWRASGTGDDCKAWGRWGSLRETERRTGGGDTHSCARGQATLLGRPGGSSGAWGLVWNTSGPGAEAPEVILRKGVSRNEKHISKECVKSTARIK